MAKRARNRLNMLFEDASAGRLIGRGFHIEWCACRRPCKRGDCYGPYEVVDDELDKLVADRFDSLVEAMRYLLLCLYVHAAWHAKQTDPGVEWIDAMRGALNALDEARLCAILET